MSKWTVRVHWTLCESEEQGKTCGARKRGKWPQIDKINHLLFQKGIRNPLEKYPIEKTNPRHFLEAVTSRYSDTIWLCGQHTAYSLRRVARPLLLSLVAPFFSRQCCFLFLFLQRCCDVCSRGVTLVKGNLWERQSGLNWAVVLWKRAVLNFKWAVSWMLYYWVYNKYRLNKNKHSLSIRFYLHMRLITLFWIC